MKLLNGAFVLAVLACGVAVYHHGLALTSQQQSTSPKPQPSATPTAHLNRNQEINNRFVKELSERIAGRENEPAEKVFKNIRIEWFKNVPAGRFLRIMNAGYSRALGVACTHCHVEQDFPSDDKRPKRAAREMAVMHKMINEQLGKMQNLEIKPEERFINCSTCHRGEINPIANPW
jgi:hypothetical protein